MSDKFSFEELWAKSGGAPEAGSLWRHYKNNHIYVVKGWAINESNQKVMVIYQRADPEGRPVPFVRPLEEFMGYVTKGVLRFAPIPTRTREGESA